MKIKLDENLGRRAVMLLRGAGHDVATVHDQHLAGVDDPVLISACAAEGRCLVTLDLEFGNPFLFRPRDYAGIALLRLARRPSIADLEYAMRTLIAGLAHDDVHGKLWVIRGGRIRAYHPDPDLDDE